MRIEAGLANGSSLDDLAADLGIGLGTVRWHVKRVMASTNTRRQGELISLLLSPLAHTKRVFGAGHMSPITHSNAVNALVCEHLSQKSMGPMRQRRTA